MTLSTKFLIGNLRVYGPLIETFRGYRKKGIKTLGNGGLLLVIPEIFNRESKGFMDP